MPEPTVSENADEAVEGAELDETTVADESAESAESAESEEPAFLNRAARRTRGKGSAGQQPQEKGKSFGGRGSVQGPRQWGNRRSG